VGRLLADAARLHGVSIVCSTHEPLVIDLADQRLSLEAGAADAGSDPVRGLTPFRREPLGD
jgi:hypothetical protein